MQLGGCGGGRGRGGAGAVQFFIDDVMDIPVVVWDWYYCGATVQKTVDIPTVRRPCASVTSSSSLEFEVEGASDSVHPLRADHSCCATVTRAHSANCAEDRRDPTGDCAVLGGC